jgi:hypothetical protein
MPTLDNRGKIAAAQIAFYTPVALIAVFLIFRYAFRRDAGWFWLFMFSAGNSIVICLLTCSKYNPQVRIANAALLIAGELLSKSNLLLAAYILEFAGVALLLLSLLGFIGMAYV